MSELATGAVMTKRLTGWHVLGTLVVFFGIIFAVNGVMTYIALTTFSGIETPNAYQTGRDYNQTLEAAAAQRALGWDVSFEETFTASGDGAQAVIAITFEDATGAPVTGLEGELIFWRPVARGADVTAQLTEQAPGRYTAETALPARGHWEMRLLMQRETAEPYYLEKRVWAGGAGSDG